MPRVLPRGIKGRYPNIERVEVTYEGTTLPAWFMKSQRKAGADSRVLRRARWREGMSILFGGVELAKRGIHTLAIDGPGQGEALRLQKSRAATTTRLPAGARTTMWRAGPTSIPSASR